MTEATKIDKNSGTWTVEYHYGNGTNTIDIHKNIGTHTEAIEKALECFINSGKYGYPESMREEVRAHLFRFGYYGDGNTSYEDEHRGLTRVEVYFEPTVKGFEAEVLVETQNEQRIGDYVRKRAAIKKQENRLWLERMQKRRDAENAAKKAKVDDPITQN